MNLKSLLSFKAHLHFSMSIPALKGLFGKDAQADIDIKILDRDHDGDPEIEVRWDLPGTKWDSGPKPRTVEIPLSKLSGSLSDIVMHSLEATGAPKLLVSTIGKLLS